MAGAIDKRHRYSYSQLTQVDSCPYAYYLNKIEHKEGLSNIFAEIGSLTHDILDEWGKGQFETTDEMADEFLFRFDLEVVTPPPARLAKLGWVDKQRNNLEDFFRNFDEFKGYKILSTEESFEVEIAGRRFVGIVDMICEENDTGALVIYDHKSKKIADFKEHEDEMYKQQYLYAKYVYEKYGRYPDKLAFHLFKENGAKFERPFDLNDYNATLEWAVHQMEKIESNEMMDWMICMEQPTKKNGTPDDCFFCENICSYRNICPFGIPVRDRPKNIT